MLFYNLLAYKAVLLLLVIDRTEVRFGSAEPVWPNRAGRGPAKPNRTFFRFSMELENFCNTEELLSEEVL